MYSEVDIVTWVDPSDGDGDPRCLRRGDGRFEGGTYDGRSGRESNRRTCIADKRRAVGSTTSFERSTMTNREGRCDRWEWWIGWSRWFENMRRIRWTGRLRWFMWKGWACSKWKTKLGEVDEDAMELGASCRTKMRSWFCRASPSEAS